MSGDRMGAAVGVATAVNTCMRTCKSARTRWARNEWVRCPTVVLLHFEQDSLSAPPRPVSI
eukprot:2701760-Pyramimonas_sp.AAC.1